MSNKSRITRPDEECPFCCIFYGSRHRMLRYLWPAKWICNMTQPLRRQPGILLPPNEKILIAITHKTLEVITVCVLVCLFLFMLSDVSFLFYFWISLHLVLFLYQYVYTYIPYIPIYLSNHQPIYSIYPWHHVPKDSYIYIPIYPFTTRAGYQKPVLMWYWFLTCQYQSTDKLQDKRCCYRYLCKVKPYKNAHV